MLIMNNEECMYKLTERYSKYVKSEKNKENKKTQYKFTFANGNWSRIQFDQ